MPEAAIVTVGGSKKPRGTAGKQMKSSSAEWKRQKLERGNFIKVQHLIRSDTRLTFPSSFLPKRPHSRGKLSFMSLISAWADETYHYMKEIFCLKHKIRGNFIGVVVYEYRIEVAPSSARKCSFTFNLSVICLIHLMSQQSGSYLSVDFTVDCSSGLWVKDKTSWMSNNVNMKCWQMTDCLLMHIINVFNPEYNFLWSKWTN